MMDDEREIERVAMRGEAPVNLLRGTLEREYDNARFIYDRNEHAFDARFCVWPGQSADGRKHGSELGVEPFPWEGASDTRVRTIDMVINDEVRLLKTSFFRARLQAIPTLPTEAMGYARKVTAMLEHTRKVDMLPYLRREIGLLANWESTYGLAICNVWWEQERRLEFLEVTREYFHEFLASQMEAMGSQWMMLDTAEMLADPLKEPLALEWMREISPVLDGRGALRALKELRAMGTARVPRPFVLSNRPRWTALRPMVDVIFPSGCDDLQRARFIAHREVVSETELKDRVRTGSYDQGFVAAAIKSKGKMMVNSTWAERTRLDRTRDTNGFLDDDRDLVELWHVFYRVTGEDGTPVVMKTVISASVPDMAGWHGPLDYAHGLYPYVAFAREDVSRSLLDSRGIPEIAFPWQNELKVQRDSRTDRTQIATVPPVITPSQRGLMNLRFGPGQHWQLRRPDDVQWMRPPPYDRGSIEIEEATKEDLSEYFGRLSKRVGPQQSQLYAQSLVEDFLGSCTLAVEQMFALGQQYWAPEHMLAVAGMDPVSADQIRAREYVQMVFDVRDLNDEQLVKKWELYSKVIRPLDQQGLIDGGVMLTRAMESMDPWMAGEAIKAPERAAEEEVEDEEIQFAKLFAGVEPPMREGGQNYGLRMEKLQSMVMQNPVNRERYAQDEIFRSLVDNRVKHFQFMLQQQDNAETGRVGAQPVLEEGKS